MNCAFTVFVLLLFNFHCALDVDTIMEKRKIGSKDDISYRERLSSEEKDRYDEKLKLLAGTDPYEIKTWSYDKKLLPSVRNFDIVFFLLATPSSYTQEEIRSYKALDAYNQFTSGWVRDVSAVECNGNSVISAKVLHSQRMREKPLQPWVICKNTGEILAGHCNCMAGLGEACSHIAALLFAVEAVTRIRDAKTPTDEKAYWMLPTAKKSVQYKEAREINFTSAKKAKRKLQEELNVAAGIISPVRSEPSETRERAVTESTDEEINGLLQCLSDSGSNAVVLSVFEPYADKFIPKAVSNAFPKPLSHLKSEACIKLTDSELLEHCSEISVTCTAEQSMAVEEATREQSRCKLWNTFRTGRITASRAKAVCSTNALCPSKSLIKSVCYPDLNKFSNSATKWGVDHEKVAKEQFLDAMATIHDDCQVSDSGFRICSEHPFIGASPDGIFRCSCCGESSLEIKCPYNARLSGLGDVKCLLSTNGGKKLDNNHEYFYQIQTQLGCLGLEKGYFVVWTEVEVHIEEVLFDEAVWKSICKKAKDFFYHAVILELVGKLHTRRSTLTTVSSCENGISTTSSDSQTFCYCKEGEHGDMIACDNQNCAIEWFHYRCVKLKKAPRGKWYCLDCKELPEFKRRRQ